MFRSESLRFGARGRGQAGKYTLEQPPEQGRPPVGPCRVRPLLRRSVLALHEAVFVRKRQTRGGTAFLRPLSLRTEGVFAQKNHHKKNIINKGERI